MADKRKLREETERLVKEAMVRRGVTIERHDTRIDLVCGKCGYHGHRLVPPDSERVSFRCKECGHTQNTI